MSSLGGRRLRIEAFFCCEEGRGLEGGGEGRRKGKGNEK